MTHFIIGLTPVPPNLPNDTTSSDGGILLSKTVESSLEEIKALSLFSNVPVIALYSLLRTTRIVSFAKGALILSQGETVTHFYIILEGWIKVFKNAVDGKESILQLLGKGSYLTETGLTRANLSHINAQVIEPVRLLAIPVPAIRSSLSRVSALSENLLAITAQRAQDTLAHTEQLTLHDAMQRVGWYILNLWLNTEQDELEITLPLDKAIIASFLNLRSETFSRVLKTLKEDGFITRGQKIKIPHDKALCKFCDPATAQNCRHAEPQCFIPPRRPID